MDDDDGPRLPVIEQPSLRFPSLKTIHITGGSERWQELLPGMYNIVHFDGSRPHLHEIVKAAIAGSYPDLISLEAQFFTAVSVRLLRRLVEARLDVNVDGAIRRPALLEEIRIRTSVEIPEEDVTWFQEHLKEFSWSSNVTNEDDDELKMAFRTS
ncbi:hypothetical protein SCP_0201500 [Sparassis crispa]|uniref:Uncharacterized protein n=1 Tax=Sparassis crispa TaxID=139825 RepID=A0A401G9Z5_9APHY|nr:hypothetical protein SCP_0201500 [Sparassis crispa]GBE78953.1 hypothetical protein SCP_0201500 [Sparassis crispa]